MSHKNQTSERNLHITLLSVASIILILTMIATLAHSAEVELQWNSVAEADGYKVYYGEASRTYQTPKEILGQSQTTQKLTLDPGTYYFAITAFNNYGESGYSEEKSTTIEASATIENPAIPTYDITASAGAYGSISPSGVVSVNEGANQGFTISPYGGYEVNDVRVDGVSVGAVSAYSFPGVDTDHVIEASFALAENEPTSSPVPDIKANGQDGPIYISSGEEILITIDLDQSIDHAGKLVDWWITCQTPDDAWYSYIWTKKWKKRRFYGGIHCTYGRGLPIHDFSSYPVLWSKGLPPGVYTFYFAVDNNFDWKPDSTWSDAVEVHIQ